LNARGDGGGDGAVHFYLRFIYERGQLGVFSLLGEHVDTPDEATKRRERERERERESEKKRKKTHSKSDSLVVLSYFPSAMTISQEHSPRSRCLMALVHYAVHRNAFEFSPSRARMRMRITYAILSPAARQDYDRFRNDLDRMRINKARERESARAREREREKKKETILLVS